MANGVVYGGGLRVSSFYALDARTGRLLWEYNLPQFEFMIGTPTIVDGAVYFAGFYDSLYAFSPKLAETEAASKPAIRPNPKTLRPNPKLKPAR